MSVAETNQAERIVRARGRFWRGVFAGVFGTFFLVSALAYYALNVQSFSIFIDQEKLAAGIRTKVHDRVLEEMPAILDQIAADASDGLLSVGDIPTLTVEIGESRLTLPVETAGLLQEQFQTAAQNSMRETLQELDPTPYADALAEEAYNLVQTTLAEEVYGQTFHFQASRWFSLPITVQGGVKQ